MPGPGQAWELLVLAAQPPVAGPPRDMQATYGSVVVAALPRPQTSAVALSKWDAFGNRHPVATLRGIPKWLHTHPNSDLTLASCRSFIGALPLLSTSMLIQCSFPGLYWA